MSIKHNKKILEIAGSYLGLKEWPGAQHNPVILDMFENVGHGHVNDDETPWCAAFVGSVLGAAGLPNSGKLTARSYESWGIKVDFNHMTPGDVVVLWRGSRTSWQGHVGFFVKYDGDNIILRGGNQGNAVSDAAYPRDRIVAVRRASSVAPTGATPVLREGDYSTWVYDLQAQLAGLGYTLGKIDGRFGSRTLAAVIAFQNDNGLVADGEVGDKTWDALAKGKKRQRRDVSMADLEKKSRTVQNASKGEKAITGGVAGVIGGVALEQIAEITKVAQQADGLVSQLSNIAPVTLIIVSVCLLAFFGLRYMKNVKEARLDDAQTGVNDRI